jgi:mevalonate kinase
VAPGKVIITGEHFVVHGASAVAAAIERKVTVRVSRAPSLKIRSNRFGSDTASVKPLRELVRQSCAKNGSDENVDLVVESGIEEGSGMGSSAATMVATVSALDKFFGWGSSKKELVELAMVGERLVHGRPSGIDVAVSAMGGVLLYKMGEEPKTLSKMMTMKIVVASSGKVRSTKKQIDKVFALS